MTTFNTPTHHEEDRPMGTPLHRQLSMHVETHPASQVYDREPYLTGSLKIGGEFHCPQDLQPGDELTVTVADADGQVICTGTAEVGGLSFPLIKEKGMVIGTERAHKADLAP